MDKIQNNALLVKVTCTKWNNTVTDKRISDDSFALASASPRLLWSKSSIS